MVSRFEAEARAAYAQIAAFYGEQTRLEPRCPGRYSEGIADPAREVRPLVGVFRRIVGNQRSSGDSPGDAFGVPLATSPTTLRYAWDDFETSPLPREKDHIVLTDRPEPLVLEVLLVDKRNPGCLVLHCQETRCDPTATLGR